MNRLTIGFFAMMLSLLAASAANAVDAWTQARLGAPSVASANYRGDQGYGRSVARENYAHAQAAAIDRNGFAYSESLAFGSRNANRNATVRYRQTGSLQLEIRVNNRRTSIVRSSAKRRHVIRVRTIRLILSD